MRRELERIEIPGEHEARVRTWETLRAAFAEREATPRRTPLLRPLLVAATLAALVTAALSPPGRAVLENVREAIGVADAEEALFSLPAGGRLLVVTANGDTFVVQRDGSRRRLGAYEEAAWSPNGRFVVATRANALFALTPKGEERWSLRRRDVARPRWGGTQTDTRIAYASAAELRVVPGDGTGDRVLDRTAGDAPSAWKPGGVHVLAYVDGAQRVVAVNADTRRVLWRTEADLRVFALAWSADGRRLLALSPTVVRVLDERGRLVRAMPMRAGTTALGAKFAPRGHVFALRLRAERGTLRGRSQVLLVNADRAMRPRQLFTGVGAFGDLAWSPDRRWLLLDWLDADQWLFIRTIGRPRIVAISNIGPQFGSAPRAPRTLDWCCP